MKKLLIFTLAAMAVSCGPSTEEPAQTAEPAAYDFYPPKKALVNDREGLLSPTREEILLEKVKEVQGSTGYAIAIATIDSLPADMDIVGYANELGNRWKVGDARKSNGVVIVLSESLGSVSIAPGKGLQDVLTDSAIEHIINQRMIPYFSMGDYYTGLNNALNEMMEMQAKRDSANEG